MTHVIATAGHVDHGKSTLVRALTGTDPDRLEEEKARGLTIDLGFAWTLLPSGREIGFVDVPGHVRFLKNMLAGVGSVEACLFVAAATEGWKPQSEEHLRILELLGVVDGVVAISKVGSIDEELRELARLEVSEHLAGTFLEKSPLIEVDAPAGIGLQEIERALDDLTHRLPDPLDRGRPRLWIDRCFSMRGVGTVVTGTLAGGTLTIDDRLEVVPGPPPSGRPRTVRVRGLQSHSRDVDRAAPGRVAVNLAGVSHGELARGQALVAPGQWEPTRRLDAQMSVLHSYDGGLSRTGAFRAHFGSGQHAVSLRVLGHETIAAGATGFVRVHLPVPLPLLPGDRFILREVGRSCTVGGGEVLDIAPVVKASRARPDRSVERVIAEHGIIEAGRLERLTGQRRPPDLAGRWVTDGGAREAAEDDLRRRIAAAGRFGLDLARLNDLERALVDTLPEASVDGSRVLLAQDGQTGTLDDHPFLTAVAASPFAPPSPQECSVTRDDLRELVRTRRIVESQGIYFAPGAIVEAARRIQLLLETHSGGVTTSLIRECLGTSRKFALPLLAHLDALGATRRRGDLRIAGARLDEIAADRGLGQER